MKKFKIPSEVAFFLATVIIAFSVAMTAKAGFGVSMIVAPAYILSLKVEFLTFGQSEYIIQGLLFIAFCIAMRGVKWTYFLSFATCLLYGAILDLWRLIPVFSDAVPSESLPIGVRIAFFVVGGLITAMTVATFFKCYLPPQVYDFFVVGLVNKYHLRQSVFKTAFDITCLLVAVVMALCFFPEYLQNGFSGAMEAFMDGKFGIGIGTVILAVVNGAIIGLCSKFLDKYMEISPFFTGFAKKFE